MLNIDVGIIIIIIIIITTSCMYIYIIFPHTYPKKHLSKPPVPHCLRMVLCLIAAIASAIFETSEASVTGKG